LEIIRLSDVEVSNPRRDDDRATLIRTVTELVPLAPQDLAARIGGISTDEVMAMLAGRLRVPSRVVTRVVVVLAEELVPLRRFLLARGHTIESYCLRPPRRGKG
jgi:hypothetical protein